MEKHLLTITIITVCYFSEATIEETIESVLNQDYPFIEYIVIDGGSTDGTLDIIKKYKKGVAKLVSEPDKGIYDAMNKGISLATGDIIGILNSDDVYTSGTIISDVVKQFTKRNIDLLYGNISYFKNDPKIAARKWITRPYYPDFFEKGDVPPHPSLFVKKAVYDKIGVYYSDFKITSDYEFMLRALKISSYPSFHLNQFIVNMRLGGESTKSIKNILIGNREISAAWRMNNIKPPLLFWPLRIFKKITQYFK